MPNSFEPKNSGIGDKVEAVREGVADKAREAGTAMSETARRAGQTIDDSRSAWADTLDSTASTIRDGADELSGGSRARDFARGTANRLSGVADYVRSHDTNRMVSDVESVVKNNPGPALVVAAAFGFLLGRALRRG